MMKRTLLLATLLLGSVAHAQSVDPHAALKSYASRILPRCPGGSLMMEPISPPGPKNFKAYVVKLTSTDQYCGSQKYLLHSPQSQQIVIGSVIPLPADNRPTPLRISTEASRLLGHPMTATVAPFPLPDGLRAVSIVRQTPYGPFSYNGFVDGSEQYLIVGFRGSLTTDPFKTMRETLGVANGVKRGNADAKVEILELSDFQCPTCARAHENLEPLIQKNLSKMSYVRIDLPLFEHHEWALPAAMGGRAIQKVAPNKYWHYVDYIFKNQEQIGKRKIDDVVREWTEDNDLDWAAVSKIYNSATERKALLEQVSRAYAAGVASTPTFVVNGQIMGFGPDGAFTIDAIRGAIGLPPAPAKKATK